MKLRVENLLPRDSGKCIGRLSSNYLRMEDLNAGDIVKVSNGSIYTAVKLLPANTNNRENVILLDNVTRNNINVDLRSRVEIEKISPYPAKKVSFKMLKKKDIEDVPNIKRFEKIIRKIYYNKPVIKTNIYQLNTRFEKNYYFKVIETIPDKIILITRDTEINLEKDIIQETYQVNIPSYKKRPKKKSEINNKNPEKTKQITFTKIGGLEKEISKITELVELPIKHPDLFSRIGIDPPRGILLYGPPGTGKTLLAKAVANESRASFFNISGPEIIQKYYGESEARLREVFDKARENSPAVIFIDEIDAIAPKRKDVKGEVEKRVVSQLLSLMDGLEERGKIVIIGATNIPDSIDNALRRPGRFDREIAIKIPDKEARTEILKIHTEKMPLSDNINLYSIAKKCHGFVGADLAALCREAAMNALREYFFSNTGNKQSKLLVELKHFKKAFKEVEPSITREVVIDSPDVKWENVGGLSEIKEKLCKLIEWPIIYPDITQEIGLTTPKGIMLVGPPGVGKTLLVKALANKVNLNFISIKGPELLSKWVGESEEGVREIFSKARQAAPCIIFFDEIDALTPKRGKNNNEVVDRVVSQFLTELDGIQELHNVIVIAATNRVDIIDQALLRPGRFDYIFRFPMPDYQARKEILKIYCNNIPVENINYHKLALMTRNLSGADLNLVCKRAALIAFEDHINNKKDKNNLNISQIKIQENDLIKSIYEIKYEKI